MRKLVWIAGVVVVAGAGLGTLARQDVFPRPRAGTGAAAVPETTVVVTWCHEELQPPRLRIPRDHKVTLWVETTGETSPGVLAIPAYGGDFAAVDIVPGERRSSVFVTRLPGDGFEILVGGRPVGRLDVTGEHVERDRL